jgi:FkbM family methyltransferase
VGLPSLAAMPSPPTPPASWKIAVVRSLTRLPVLRVPAVRRALVDLQRARRRRARLREEARGSDALSRRALHGMDAKLQRWLDLDWGFFVEAGANDGVEQSNTYWLERFRGWRGVLVEPVPELHRLAVRERPGARVINCALVAPEDAGGEVAMRYGGLMTVVQGAHGSPDDDRAFVAPAFALGFEDEYEFSVPARTLSSILDEVRAPEVDLLSLDVEGYEPQVLRGLDLDRHAPRFLLVEMHDLEAGRRAVEAVLGERYVAVEQLSPLDLLYARADQPGARDQAGAGGDQPGARDQAGAGGGPTSER